MEAKLNITGDNGETLLKTNCKSIDRAIDELAALARSMEKKKRDTKFFFSECPDNCPLCDEKIEAKYFNYDDSKFQYFFYCECGATLILKDNGTEDGPITEHYKDEVRKWADNFNS